MFDVVSAYVVRIIVAALYADCGELHTAMAMRALRVQPRIVHNCEFANRPVSDADALGIKVSETKIAVRAEHVNSPQHRNLPVLCLAVSMPRTPKGHKRPADVVSNAVHVMRIATGEIDETLTDDGRNKAAVALGRMGGLARAKSITKADRVKIAKKAAKKRWGKA